HEGEVERLPDIDWEALARIDGTVVCYAGARLAPALREALVDRGSPGERAAALIYRGTQPSQHTFTGTIVEVAERAAATGGDEAAIVVVGDVTSLRDHLRWFDERPLFGKRIVVTRSPDQAREL